VQPELSPPKVSGVRVRPKLTDDNFPGGGAKGAGFLRVCPEFGPCAIVWEFGGKIGCPLFAGKTGPGADTAAAAAHSATEGAPRAPDVATATVPKAADHGAIVFMDGSCLSLAHPHIGQKLSETLPCPLLSSC